MKTLVVYYSKTGTTKRVAQSVAEKSASDFDEIQYDEAAKSIKSRHNPADYERVILLSPVWALSLAEPMKLYLAKYKSGIKKYNLIVTCGSMGHRGCVKNCKSIIGIPPEKSMKIKSKAVKEGNFDVSSAL